MTEVVVLAPFLASSRDMSARAEHCIRQISRTDDPRANICAETAALRRHGQSQQRSAPLHLALAIARQTLRLLHDPDQRATVFLDLAATQQVLGALTGDIACTAAALEACHDALDCAPPAPRLFHRAAALAETARLHACIGRRTGDPLHLSEAATLYRAAATAYALRRDKSDRMRGWAQAQHDLGRTLSALSELPDQAQRYRPAIRALHHALRIHTRESDPVLWAETLCDLGLARLELSLIEQNGALLREAVFALRSALTVLQPDRHPETWAAAQGHLARALQTLAAVSHDPVILQQAVAAFDATLAHRHSSAASLDRAATEAELGNTLQDLGRAMGDPAPITRALSAYRAARETYLRLGHDHDASGVLYNIGRSHAALFDLTRDPACFALAQAAFGDVLSNQSDDWFLHRAQDEALRLRIASGAPP